MKKIIILLSVILANLIGMEAQTVIESELVSVASENTVRVNITKSDVPYRIGKGTTVIIPTFEGDLWDED